jgi:hypothetical protein
VQYDVFLKNKRWPVGLALVLLGVYLFPLFSSVIYTETFDNLDSTVIWMKLLAESGEIFSDSSAIIPNMMNGLPRISYGSEFNMLLWLYKFFGPEAAFRINEFLIHTTAFVSMYLLLERYFRFENRYRSWIVVASALLFALLPFWPGAGLSTSTLPLLTYILLNIRNKLEQKWEWVTLILNPLYSSFVFLLIFYLAFSWAAFLADMLKNGHLNRRLLWALLLVTLVAMATEYRLFVSLMTGGEFVSHRSEFNIYFVHPVKKAYYYAVKFFLDGWMEHQRSLIMPWLLPLMIVAMVLSIWKRRFSSTESVLLWTIVFLSLYFDLWQRVLTNGYTMPWILVLSLIALRKAEPPFQWLAWIMIVQLALAFYNGLCFYGGLAWLKEWFPIFNQFNISRAAFIQPLVWYVGIAFTFGAYARYMTLFPFFLLLVVAVQFYYSSSVRRFTDESKFKYMSFGAYYAPGLFERIRKDIGREQQSYRVVSYGIEPAVSLYNGFYTVDGYSTNYPLAYKHAIEDVQQEECLADSPGNRKLMHGWGSKAYLVCIESRPENYRYFEEHNITSIPFKASVEKLCNLGADYVVSGHALRLEKSQPMELMGAYEDNKTTPWKIWLYRLKCKETEEGRHSL